MDETSTTKKNTNLEFRYNERNSLFTRVNESVFEFG